MKSGRVVDKMKASGDPRDRYELLAKIGKGGYGYVCKALDTFNDTLVAIKIINLEDAGDEVEDVHQEIAVMKNMNCPQLTKYYASYVFGSNLWIIMEYLEAGSLLDIIKEHGPLTEPFVAYVMKELISALAYLHSERKIHRDIKSGNILVASDGSVKLADFGVTGQLTDSIDKRQTKIGTPFWMAPEVISQSAYDGCADIWSAGITAIELCKGAPPYANRIHPFQAILLIPKNPPPVLEGNFSEEFKDFVACCLVKNPSDRPAAATLLRHPFLTRVEGVPPPWTAFVARTVDERRSKTIAMSADESLEADRLGFDTGDWNFTVRTGMSYSNSRNGSGANSRTHSRSNSRMGSFSYGIDASSSNSTQGASHSRSNSRSFSCSQSHSGGGGGGGLEFSIAVRSSSAMKEGMFRSSSSDSDAGSADDILSDDGNGAPTPKSVHGRRTPTPAAVAEAVTTTAGAIAGTTGTGATTSFDYEGISFPTHYPPKQRAGKSPSGRIGSGSPTNSNSNNNGGSANLSSPRNGPPPRPKHLSIVESNGSTSASSGGSSSGGAAAALQGGALSSSSAEWSQQAEASRRQEERLANLQAEVQALVRENALLRSLSAPYLRTLDTLAKHERCSSVVASPDKNLTSAKSSSAANSSVRQEKSISDDIPDIPSFTAGVQRIIYPSRSSSAGPAAGKPALTAEELVGYATALTKRSLRGSSTAHASIVRPALNQLKNRVSSRIQHLTQACAGAAAGAGVGEGSIKLGSGTKRGGAAEQLKDVLGLLTVAFSALDAFDESNPVRRHQQQTAAAVTVAAAVNAAKVAATSDQLHSPSISLTAPTPRAVHGSASPEKMPPGASISLSGQEQGRMSDAVVMATEDSVVPGVGSLDLVTLLIAYLEDDLKQVPPSAGAKR